VGVSSSGVNASLDSLALRAVNDAVLTIAAERRFEPVLEKLVVAARELVSARYAAVGIPDGEGGFAHFITDGMSQKQLDALGELPQQHGLLAAMLAETRSFRAPNIQEDPRFEGWPDEHPSMRSFLGVPIVSRGATVGAFYLTDKKGARGALFTGDDQALIETLAAHAALAIENARLHERSRELTVVEERNRLARELHDAVNQTLFSVSLTADAAALLVDSEPARAKEQMAAVRELARGAMEEMRSLVFELRPADLSADGLVETLRKHVGVLRRVSGREIVLDVGAERRLPADTEQEVFRIAQEALANTLRHSGAASVRVRLDMPDGRLLLAVADDGSGFDPAGVAAGRHLGLVSMRERAAALGGELRVESAPGSGTTISMEVPWSGSRS
jgi:signal transduction histidine kinase